VKYIVVLGDGMADYPLEELNGKTPLQYADTPNMDRLAEQGEVGLVKTVPDNMPAGSDVANLSVLGYDPQKYYTGRSPLEAGGASTAVPAGMVRANSGRGAAHAGGQAGEHSSTAKGQGLSVKGCSKEVSRRKG